MSVIACLSEGIKAWLSFLEQNSHKSMDSNYRTSANVNIYSELFCLLNQTVLDAFS